MTEHEIQTEILQYLSVRGIPAGRTNTGGAIYGSGASRRFVRFNDPGAADICGIIPPHGRSLFIEVKSKTGRLSELQEKWLAIREAAGALCIVARSVDDVKEALEK